jgi:hypothetical protein
MAGELTVREQPQLPDTLEARKKAADLQVQTAEYWAQCLMRVVDKAKLSKTLGYGDKTKKYLQVEGWQLIAEFAHVRFPIEWVREWRSDAGELIGYRARCRLVDQDDREVGSGESSCGFDAYPCKDKKGSDRDKAAASAAQTWAISRALRNKFSYIAQIGGYEPVPAEEMYDPQHHTPREPTGKPSPQTPPIKTERSMLGVEILAYCNNDRARAKEELFKLTGKKSFQDVTNDDAIKARAELKKKLEIKKDDDIPSFVSGNHAHYCPMCGKDVPCAQITECKRPEQDICADCS